MKNKFFSVFTIFVLLVCITTSFSKKSLLVAYAINEEVMIISDVNNKVHNFSKSKQAIGNVPFCSNRVAIHFGNSTGSIMPAVQYMVFYHPIKASVERVSNNLIDQSRFMISENNFLNINNSFRKTYFLQSSGIVALVDEKGCF